MNELTKEELRGLLDMSIKLIPVLNRNEATRLALVYKDIIKRLEKEGLVYEE